MSLDMNKFSLTKHDSEIVELISITDHKILAQWAIDCLIRILPAFKERYPDETAPQNAIKILKEWMKDKIPMWEARKYCWTILKLAREIEKYDKASAQIVRASSHCLATCHVPTHSEGTAMYVISAIKYLNQDKSNVIELMENERKWQIEHLLKLRKNN